MPKFVKKRAKKIGAPPGTLVHIGRKKAEKIRIQIIGYDQTNFREKEAKTIEECFPFRDEPSVTWINVDGLHEVEVLEKLGLAYGLHHLVLEDILNTDQRPKMDDLDDYIYLVLKMLSFNHESDELQVEQVSLILGRNFVISFQEREGDVFDPIRERLRSNKGRIRKMGADYLAYSLMDIIVDNYFVALEKIGERIEAVEEELIVNPPTETLQTLHTLKREMIFLRRSVWPLRDAISGLERGGSTLIDESTLIYLRDLYDHTVHVIDTVETYREMLAGLHDIYLSSISNRMNEVMKVLTIIATIFIPLGFIAGVYGMNFKYIPELNLQWGYFYALFGMLLISVLMLLYFRKKKWL